ncbi:hypothetical protein KSF78_0007587 [Schistosoma japonicum]|nr:hypothetical protein KSF78_0007587 [Schistosoma japonicum]KAH8861744.1 hypothetical protein KSF78_0007587 [Schistosoma japonicum]KAH8861745.1 hypothetical protein KSF78_0007587 [Schistosoma japonicum]KAH8861748.1 hypothetical protein KSF78_0007587 [Schistosoma japonicum]KAH8861749.1 hypothetical protein KSF78_0007587 [Schistosoma japonicum]
MSLNSEWLTQQLFKDSNADAYPRYPGCIMRSDFWDKTISTSKQVRFRQNVLDSANGSADRVSTYDFTEAGFDELTNVTSFSNSDSISVPQTRCPLDNKSTLDQFCFTQTSCDAPETMKNNANNIGNFLMDTDCHYSNNCQSVSFLRTTDHLPQQPLLLPGSSVYNSRNHSSNLQCSSDQDPRELPGYLNNHPKDLSLSSLTDLSCLDTETTSLCDPADVSKNFSQPVSNTVRILEREINALTLKVNNVSNENPTDEIYLEAERVVNEACSTLPCGNNSTNPLILNPRITVNLPGDISMYENLIDLTVDESEIVRLERQRIAAQRKRLDASRKQNIKDKASEPEPDLLEFFDPNRHVYQSINLQPKGIRRSLLPTLNCASDDLVNALHRKIAHDHSFWC